MVFLWYCFSHQVIHPHKECAFVLTMLLIDLVLWFSELNLAVDSFTKQNLTIEDRISHSPSMEDSNTDGKLKKCEWRGFKEGTSHKSWVG